jgi:hypothetical protein
VFPAPAAVPVDRFGGSGLVGPLTERPVSGVWARSRSRPVPPARRLGDAFGFCASRTARRDAGRFLAFLARALALRTPCEERVFFRFNPLARAAGRAGREDFLPAFRRAAEVRFDPLVRADARAPDLARLFDGVGLCRLLELFRADPAALRFAAFLAMVLDPCLSISRGASPRNQRIDCRALSDVSSNAYRN